MDATKTTSRQGTAMSTDTTKTTIRAITVSTGYKGDHGVNASIPLTTTSLEQATERTLVALAGIYGELSEIEVAWVTPVIRQAFDGVDWSEMPATQADMDAMGLPEDIDAIYLAVDMSKKSIDTEKFIG